jgi:phenylacetate-coenzyme A ligase PaaK-like adenylate-forming protein
MTEMYAPDRSVLRSRLSGAIGAHMPGGIERLGWDAGRLAAYQRARLRALLARAAGHSPFHARRLGGIDLSRFELADLAGLPVMTKDQLMAEFGQVVTDPRLRRANVDEHLAAAVSEPGLLVHSSGFAAAVADGPPVQIIPAPVTLPLAEIVARLNAARPPALLGYPTMLRQLAGEQRAGRLRIAPTSVTTLGEPLTPADAGSITEAFGVGVIDMFVSTEGLVGHSEPGGTVLSFGSDLCLAELVDERNRPVPAGTSSAKVLVTNLHNLTQPLIRYELTDRFTPAPAAPGHGHLRASVDGRNDAPLRYGDVEVHPLVIRTVFTKAAAIREYQVRQTERGVAADLAVDGTLDTAAVARSVEMSLRAAGVPDPRAEVRVVSAVERHPETGKVRRFIPLAVVPEARQ